MSRFLSGTLRDMEPYIPGEQPQDKKYVKLNTNESPYSPSLLVRDAIARFSHSDLRLYPDPDSSRLKKAAAKAYGLGESEIFAAGGSDEALAFAFMAFFDRGGKVCFPDITYGFYSVYAGLFGLESREIPLNPDFTVNINDYIETDENIFLANPNAPTGICLSPAQIEEILSAKPNRLLVLDEAYIDFAPGKSCETLIRKYDNLLVVRTFSKSRALAGMRLSLAFGNPSLIDGLERVKYSFNPYNIDRISTEVAIAALEDREYLASVTARIIKTRVDTARTLAEIGFTILPSEANFIFAKADFIGGKELYQKLKDKGVLVRHFGKDRISDFVRITIGTEKEMTFLLDKIAEIRGEAQV